MGKKEKGEGNCWGREALVVMVLNCLAAGKGEDGVEEAGNIGESGEN